jgi:hypothetical protein
LDLSTGLGLVLAEQDEEEEEDEERWFLRYQEGWDRDESEEGWDSEFEEAVYIERTIEMVEECVRRAGRIPMSIRLDYETPACQFALFPLLDCLAKYSHRLREFSLGKLPQAALYRIGQLRYKFSQLRKIELRA